MISWVVYIAIGLVIGGAVGFFLGRLDDFSQKERRTMQDKLEQARKELAEYKHDVTDHFIATAGLVNNLTESYQAVHEHLVNGARSLCDHQVAVNRLEVTHSASIEKTGMKTEEVNEQTEAVVSSDTAQARQETESLQVDATLQVENIPEAEQPQNPTPPSDTKQAVENNPLKTEQTAETNQTQTSPQEPSREKSSDKDGARELPADESAVVSDQNELTMASRMVH